LQQFAGGFNFIDAGQPQQCGRIKLASRIGIHAFCQ
jgi:hypothetical protein